MSGKTLSNFLELNELLHRKWQASPIELLGYIGFKKLQLTKQE